MEFSLDPAQAELKARAREFARTVVLARAAEIDRQEQYPWDIVKALAIHQPVASLRVTLRCTQPRGASTAWLIRFANQ